MVSTKLCFLFILIFASCRQENKFLLKQFDIGSNDADTIMHYAKNNVYLLNVKDYGFLGEYKNQFVFTKGQSLSGYKIETGKLIFSHSNKSIGLITPGEYSSGWFLVKNHHTIPVLPKLDSIRSLVHIKYVHYFIHEENGVFTVFKDSKLIQKESYGSFFREKNTLWKTILIMVYTGLKIEN